MRDVREAYRRYLTTTNDRGANVLSFGEWLEDRYNALMELMNSVTRESELETGYFEQFRGDEPAEQPDPFYGVR